MKRTVTSFGNLGLTLCVSLVLGLVMAACENPVESESHDYVVKVKPSSLVWLQGGSDQVIAFGCEGFKDGKTDSSLTLTEWEAIGMDGGTTLDPATGELVISAQQANGSITVTGHNRAKGVAVSKTITEVKQKDLWEKLKTFYAAKTADSLKSVMGINLELVDKDSYANAGLPTFSSYGLPDTWPTGQTNYATALLSLVKALNQSLSSLFGVDTTAQTALMSKISSATTADEVFALLTEENFAVLWPNGKYHTDGNWDVYAVLSDAQKRKIAQEVYVAHSYSAIPGCIDAMRVAQANGMAKEWAGKSASELLAEFNRANFLLLNLSAKEWDDFDAQPLEKKMAAAGVLAAAMASSAPANGTDLETLFLEAVNSALPDLIGLLSVTQNGNANQSTTRLTLTFAEAVSELDEDNIKINPAYFTVTSVYAVSNTQNKKWYAEGTTSSSVNGQATIEVKVTRAGISSAPVTGIIIYKPIPVSITGSADGSVRNATTAYITLTDNYNQITSGLGQYITGVSGQWTISSRSGNTIYLGSGNVTTYGTQDLYLTFSGTGYENVNQYPVTVYKVFQASSQVTATAHSRKTNGKIPDYIDIELSSTDVWPFSTSWSSTDFSLPGGLSVTSATCLPNGTTLRVYVTGTPTSTTGTIDINKDGYSSSNLGNISVTGLADGQIEVISITANAASGGSATDSLTITVDKPIDWDDFTIVTGLTGLTVTGISGTAPTNTASCTFAVDNQLSAQGTISANGFSITSTADYTFGNSVSLQDTTIAAP